MQLRDAGPCRHRRHFAPAVSAVSGFYDYLEHRALAALMVGRPWSHRDVRIPVPAADRDRPGQRFGTVRRNPRRRRWTSDLFHRRFHHPAGTLL